MSRYWVGSLMQCVGLVLAGANAFFVWYGVETDPWWSTTLSAVAVVGGIVMFIVGAMIRLGAPREHREPEEDLDSNANATIRAYYASAAPGTNPSYYTSPGYAVSSSTGYTLPPSGAVPPLPALSNPPEEYQGEFKGWRSFGLTVDEHYRYLLRGSHGTTWETGELDAVCLALSIYAPDGTCREHLKQARCGCGIYMMKALDKGWISSAIQNPGVILAQCSAWGVVVEGEHGFRAEHCRIDRLYVDDTNPELMESLCNRYKCLVLSLQEHATPLLTGRLT